MRRMRAREKIYTANAADIRVRGTVRQIVSKFESLGYEAQCNKDEVLAHVFFQTAEHYKKVQNAE